MILLFRLVQNALSPKHQFVANSVGKTWGKMIAAIEHIVDVLFFSMEVGMCKRYRNKKMKENSNNKWQKILEFKLQYNK